MVPKIAFLSESTLTSLSRFDCSREKVRWIWSRGREERGEGGGRKGGGKEGEKEGGRERGGREGRREKRREGGEDGGRPRSK